MCFFFLMTQLPVGIFNLSQVTNIRQYVQRFQHIEITGSIFSCNTHITFWIVHITKAYTSAWAGLRTGNFYIANQ